MKKPDPRVRRAEKLLAEVMRLLGEIRDGVPPPRQKRRRKQPRRYKLPAILAALREGAVLDASGSERDPRLPSKTVLAKYRKRNPAFDREAREILHQRWINAKRGCVRPIRGATSWAKKLPGRRYDWEAIAAKIEAGATIGPASPNRQGIPCHTLIMQRRRADPVFAARVARVLESRFGSGRRIRIDREATLELIRRGAVIKAWPPEPGMPRKDLINRERREDPAFNVAVLTAIREARRRRGNRLRLARLPRDAAWRAAIAAVPRSISPDLRDDLVAELSLMICSGETAVDGDLAAAWKACRTRLNRLRWRESSLDTPIAGTSDLRRIDLLAEDVEHV